MLIIYFCSTLPSHSFADIDLKDIGGKIKEGFGIVGEKAKACSQVVTLGMEWTAKQGYYQTAVKVLEAAKALQKADPRLVSLATAQKSAEIALKLSQDALDAAQKASVVTATGTKLIGDVASKAFDIKSISFQTTSEKLLKDKSLALKIEGIIAGKSFARQAEGVNFSSSDDFVKSILNNLKT